MKFCPECGNPWNGSKFCSECGMDLRAHLGDAPKTEETATSFGDSFGTVDASAFADFASFAEARETETEQGLVMASLKAFEVEELSEGRYIILRLKNPRLMSVTVPDCVEAIADEAFAESDIMDVTLPEGLRKIGRRAFADCYDLETINLPSSLRVIGDEAFAGCEALPLPQIPARVRVGERVFDASKTEFDVVLMDAGESKLEVIKAVRSFTGLGLKDAKDLVDAAPQIVVSGTSQKEGAAIVAAFKKLGAVAVLK